MTQEEKYQEAKKVVQMHEQQLKQAPVNCWAFNLNDYILVKLKDEGFKFWLNKINQFLPKDLMATEEELRARADKDGYIAFQAWDFMKTFGETISMGFEANFETTVRLFRSEIKPCS